MNNEIQNITSAVNVIKTAILQSQTHAAKAVNQEMLALYFGIGRFISANTRNRNWGKGVLARISERLRSELPGLRGFGESSLKNMRLFYEAWNFIESNSPIGIGELTDKTTIAVEDSSNLCNNETDTIRQLQLTNLPDFPLTEFLSISFTHHVRILENAKVLEERLFYIRYCYNYKPAADDVRNIIKTKDLYNHQEELPNNFLTTIPDYKQAFHSMQMFKDEYLLDFINVEEIGMRDEEIDERVIEQNIVHNVKNFIMTFGKGFAFIGNQVHYDKLGHDHWIDLLFYNRDLRRTVVFELKKGNFKVAYLAQLSSYLRILNDDDRREGENAPIGIILCKNMDKEYVNYIMQDFRQPMGVATYKTADEVEPDVLKLLPPKEELIKLIK
ncbi:MAG: PDDEXK nuclease domain-containing protein [Prevotella sp.]|nr:PDDEXK nuclease domain-containing protein [Prevotella sp.]MCI6371522.1 PDDEXK nuclease domain-containing protein [Prevotella sp.]MCI6404246.1 PDDEXK nuclease domain-containing protein [Prevotella sp.]MDD6537318.1 PDDEXK nuclease domain-containing protein [Prevotella sp.]MDD7507854.1 PDDEXK nuclease domain-containing protein [Prevotella sp.]